MGYWNATMAGESLVPIDTGVYWGDTPADILAEAIQQIDAAFQRDLGKRVSLAELQAGLLFGYQGEDT